MTLARKTARVAAPQVETRLPDWFEAIHDPGGVIARNVLRLDQLAAKRGVRLYPQTDFHTLKAIVETHRSQGTVLMPHVDPTYSTINGENGIWILGVDAQGNAATTQTGRYYDFTGSSLAAEMASFRFFYDEPARHLTPECYCRAPRDAAEVITGTAVSSGTIWVRPDMRGPGEEGIVLSQLLGKLTRLIAIARWWPKHMFTFSSYDLYNRGVVRNFGWPHESFVTEWHFPYGPVAPAGMFWMTREEMLGWAADDFKQPAAA